MKNLRLRGYDVIIPKRKQIWTRLKTSFRLIYVISLYRIYMASMESKILKNRSKGAITSRDDVIKPIWKWIWIQLEKYFRLIYWTLYRTYIAPMASKIVKNQSFRGYDVTWWRHNTKTKTDLNSTQNILSIDILQAYIGSLWHQWNRKYYNQIHSLWTHLF